MNTCIRTAFIALAIFGHHLAAEATLGMAIYALVKNKEKALVTTTIRDTFEFACFEPTALRCAYVASEVNRAYGNMKPRAKDEPPANAKVTGPGWELICHAGAGECSAAFGRLAANPNIFK